MSQVLDLTDLIPTKATALHSLMRILVATLAERSRDPLPPSSVGRYRFSTYMGSKLLLETSHNGTEEQADTLSEIFRETLRNAKEYNMDWVKKPEQLWRNTLVNLEEGEKLCKASKKLLHLEEKGPTGEKGKARNDRHEKVLALIPKIYEKMQKLKDAAKDLVAVFHGLTAEVERRSSPRPAYLDLEKIINSIRYHRSYISTEAATEKFSVAIAEQQKTTFELFWQGTMKLKKRIQTSMHILMTKMGMNKKAEEADTKQWDGNDPKKAVDELYSMVMDINKELDRFTTVKLEVEEKHVDHLKEIGLPNIFMDDNYKSALSLKHDLEEWKEVHQGVGLGADPLLMRSISRVKYLEGLTERIRPLCHHLEILELRDGFENTDQAVRDLDYDEKICGACRPTTMEGWEEELLQSGNRGKA